MSRAAFRGLLFSGVWVAVVVFAMSMTVTMRPAVAEDQLPAELAIEEAAPGTSVYGSCVASAVAVYRYPLGKRIHLRCASAAPGTTISYFALPISAGTVSNPIEDYFMTAITMAVANGKTVAVWYDTDAGVGPSIGCQAADCRLLRGIAVNK